MSDIPRGWTEEIFEDITEIASGQVDPTEPPYIDYPHIAPDNIKSHTGRINGVKTARELGITSGKYLFDEYAIVYTKIRPNLNKVCVPGYVGTCSADMYPIWACDGINSFYLFQYMLADSFLRQAIAVSTRTGLPKINRTDLNKITVLIPPLEEQRAIADILSTWDEAIVLTEALIEALQQRKKGLMQKLLTGEVRFSEFVESEEFSDTKVGEIPTNWAVSEIGDVSFITKLAGFEYTEHFDYSIGGEIIAVRGLNIKNGRLDLTDIHTIPRQTSESLPRSQLNEGDLVMGYVGTIGEVAIIDADDTYHLAPNVAKISLNQNLVNPFYMLQQMYSDRFQHELVILATTTSQAALSMTNLRKARIRLAPLNEQEAISQVLAVCDKEIDLLVSSIQQLQQQKKGLMQQLLTGQVRVKVDVS